MLIIPLQFFHRLRKKASIIIRTVLWSVHNLA